MLSIGGTALLRAHLPSTRIAWQRGLQCIIQARHQGSAAVAAVASNNDGLARQMAEALTIEEARELWQAAQKMDGVPSIDLLNAYLGKRVNMTKRTRRFRESRQHFQFVKEYESKGLAPNLATYSILAQLMQDGAYAENVPKSEQEAHQSFLVEGANHICRSIIAEMATAQERKAQGPVLLDTCTKWLRTYTSAKCLTLETYATALQSLGRHLQYRHVLRIIQLCRAEFPVDDTTRPLYVRLYSVAAHSLFAAQRYKRLLILFFDMHNSSIGPVPPVLAYCALHLCSVLQPPKTPTLFRWLAAGTGEDARMYRYLLDSYARLKDVDGMVRVVEEMGRKVPSTVEVYTALLQAFRRRAAPGDARRLLGAYTAMREKCTDRPVSYEPYEAALWAVDHIEPEGSEDMPGAQALWRQRVLSDAKQDGHPLFWFLHS